MGKPLGPVGYREIAAKWPHSQWGRVQSVVDKADDHLGAVVVEKEEVPSSDQMVGHVVVGMGVGLRVGVLVVHQGLRSIVDHTLVHQIGPFHQ